MAAAMIGTIEVVWHLIRHRRRREPIPAAVAAVMVIGLIVPFALGLALITPATEITGILRTLLLFTAVFFVVLGAVMSLHAIHQIARSDEDPKAYSNLQRIFYGIASALAFVSYLL